MTIEQFIEKLANVEGTDELTNPYKKDNRKHNLAIYLDYMVKQQPEYLFVGEAPGHLGCALTGIPFTDEYRLTPNGKRGCSPLQSPDYVIEPGVPHRENTATVIWNVLSEESFFPLLWNIVPFHPHERGNEKSNRAPCAQEIEAYSCFVEDLLKIFPSIKCKCGIYAVGRTPEEKLIRMGIDAQYIRHPARGGATKCTEKIRVIAKCSN